MGLPLRRPKPSFVVAVQAPLYRPLPREFTPSDFVYPTTRPARSQEEPPLPGIVGRNLTRVVPKTQSSPSFWQGGPNRPCPDLWDHQRPGDQDSMSQRPTASHPESRSLSDGRNITLPPVNLRPHDEQPARHGHGGDALQEHRSQQPSHQIGTLSSAPSYPSMLSGDDRTTAGTSRGLGVHTMLNPTEPEARKASPTTGPVSPSPLLERRLSQQAASTDAVRPASPFKRSPNSPFHPAIDHGIYGGKGRKILTPKSPRSVSLGGQAMGVLRSAEPLSFAHEGRLYGAIPGSRESSVPPMPTMPAQSQHLYNFPPPVSGPPLSRRASVAAMGPRLPHSQSASPSPSYSPYSSQPSPASIYGKTPQGTSYFSGPALRGALVEGGSSQVAPPGTEGPYMTPLSESILFQGSPSSGHGPNIKMLPYPTEHGEFYMPVEVGAASKSADEKRKRNAGASARFRERRKLREKESTTNIQKLKQQSDDLERKLRETEQERDFYRLERDRFWDVLYRNPATRELAMQAPRSPRSTRPPTLPLATPGGPAYQTPESELSQGGRASRRRRMDTPEEYRYSLPPAAAYPPAPPHPGYPTRPEAGLHPQNPPPLHPESAPGPGMGLMGAPPPVSQRAPYNPYPRGGYERTWPGGPPPPGDASSQRK